jgi:hypothetical protein
MKSHMGFYATFAYGRDRAWSASEVTTVLGLGVEV